MTKLFNLSISKKNNSKDEIIEFDIGDNNNGGKKL